MHKRYDAYNRDKNLRAFYQSRTWKELRRLVLERYDWLDLYALAHGRMEVADTVHHIVPVREDWNARYDIENLIPLSSENHNSIHSLYETPDGEALKAELRRIINESANAWGAAGQGGLKKYEGHALETDAWP